MTLLLPTLDVISGLNPEKEQQPEKNIEVVRTPELDEILTKFSEFAKPKGRLHSCADAFDYAPRGISSDTITNASILLSNMGYHVPSRVIGYYITALINQSQNNCHRIFSNAAPEYVGTEIQEGTYVEVCGQTGDFTGCHNRGTLVLQGRTRHFLGMDNYGLIIANGAAGEGIGLENHGTIHLNDTFGNFDHHEGRIIVKGVIAWDGGRR